MDLLFKATHFIGLIIWMAGLLSYSRILVAFGESRSLESAERSILQKHYAGLLNKIYKLLSNPGMLLVLIGGIAMIAQNTAYLKMGWMHPKLLLVVLLIGYQHMSKSVFKKILSGDTKWTNARLKKLSLIPIVLMLLIVVLAVFKFF